MATNTHLAFSPTQNLLAWTDNGGVLARWPSPIPPTAPDPVKTPSVSTTTIQGKRRATPGLFGDEENAKGGEDAADERDDFGMMIGLLMILVGEWRMIRRRRRGLGREEGMGLLRRWVGIEFPSNVG